MSDEKGRGRQDAPDMNTVKKRKKSRAVSFGLYALLFVFVCLLTFVVTAILFIPSDFYNSPGEIPETAGEMTDEPADTSPLDTPVGDSVFRVTDAETLYMLAEADAFDEFYRIHGSEPIVLIDSGVTLDRPFDINGGIELIVSQDVTFADGVKIRINASGERTVRITCDEPLSRFVIDAPESALYYTGGSLPFMREVAEMQNVASYNGTPTAGGADGDTLGGAGSGKATGVTVYRGKKKDDVWDGSYSSVSGNLITVYVPHDASDGDIASLFISVAASGGTCDISSPLDLSSPKLVDVVDGEGRTRTYRITAQRARLGIPIVEIYTENGAPIDSDETYLRALMKIDGEKYELSVKGRGNASWTKFAKKSYRLKLDRKAKLCGMNSDRDWCLIGNYADPSLIRNKLASDMAMIMTRLPYTPSYRNVDLFINGEYYGVFMLAEKIEASNDKVVLGDRVTDSDGSISDMGFMLEVGWDYSSGNVNTKDYFNTSYVRYIYIREPEITKAKNAEFNYIYNYIRATEKAIISGKGYEDYIDVDSWVDWFIVNELTNCTECAFYRSLYMYKPVGGKLTAGPIWDYDMAFGNNLADIPGYDGWACVDFTYEFLYDNWMKFLVGDEKFMSRVRERWAEMKGPLMETARASIAESVAEISSSQVYNFRLWPEVLRHQIGMSLASTLGLKTWEKQVAYVSDFLADRYAWMDDKLS